MTKLNIGATVPRKGWTTVDIENAEITHDLRRFPWPFRDASAEAILASHILEHVSREEGVEFLRECFRILLPGAALRVVVPDLDKFIDAHVSGDMTPLGGYAWTDINYLMGGPPDKEVRRHWRHYYAYCFTSLAYTLQMVGFQNIVRATCQKSIRAVFEQVDTPEYEAFSLYVEAEKPQNV